MLKRLALVLSCLLLVSNLVTSVQPLAAAQVGPPSWPLEWQADSDFFGVWARADGPVAMQAAPRSWLWGPVPFAVANEPYAESPTGKRLVEYFDKGRMEVNDPARDRASNWFVTSGLLVNEMVNGQIQTGNGTFEARAPAEVPVAGDSGSPNAPTYALFAPLTTPVPQAIGDISQQLLGPGGSLQPLPQPVSGLDQKVTISGRYDEVTGHNIPAIFADWMQQSGVVLQNGRLTQAQLMDPLFVLGRPVTEAVWVDVQVAGVPARVLVQLFERRALTYNPANPPEWQVEMANVSRAYFDWRYGNTSPMPAISAEVDHDGVRLRGWNWPPGAHVKTRVELAGAPEPLAVPQVVRADQAGRFGLVITMTAELEGALLSGANLRASASSGDAQTALPLAGRPPAGDAAIEGMITAVLRNSAAENILLVRDFTGKERKVSLAVRSTISYSEGNPAPLSLLTTGTNVRVEGSQRAGTFTASSVRLMSQSRTGARLGYQVVPDERNVRLTGTGWPAGADVLMTARPFSGEGGVQIGSVRSDSRGNLIGSFSLPDGKLPAESLWLFAQVVQDNSLVAQVAVPYGAAGLPQESTRPPAVTVLSSGGEQMGGLGSYCWRGVCPRTVGTPLPGEALPARPGELLAFRSQLGPDSNAGLTPLRMAGEIYAYPAANSPELTGIEGSIYFAPQSLPVMNTGDVAGRPFGLTMPSAMAPGRYILLLSVVWSNGPDRPEDAVYGFTLDVPSNAAH